MKGTDAPPLAPVPRLIDAEEAAEMLSVSPQWVLAQARAGRIPHVRLGRYVRFEREQLEAWWSRRRRGPGLGL
jgi:excisionase family DNA binding protein